MLPCVGPHVWLCLVGAPSRYQLRASHVGAPLPYQLHALHVGVEEQELVAALAVGNYFQ